ncbi:hypothetical protein Bca52824_023233 [Brassica carinata]|uniref:Uncharacterized protein n=1 Tax=Brassica carinata TaxID=52824 RepID=A0A8X7VID6_BRACI|nr:hypothetical protein Bca52824_023233 [Brassica carinata]
MRFAKRKLDESVFLGNRLQISYAPEFESLSDTKDKLETRRKEVLSRSNPQKAKSSVSQVTKPALTQMDSFSPQSEVTTVNPAVSHFRPKMVLNGAASQGTDAVVVVFQQILLQITMLDPGLPNLNQPYDSLLFKIYHWSREKTLSATLPDADTSSAKSSLDEDENTSSISDAQTMQNKDPTNDTEEVDLETSLKPQDTAANDAITVEAVIKQFSGTGYESSDVMVIDELEMQRHHQLEKLYRSTRSAKVN